MQPRNVHDSRDDIQIVDVREPHEWGAGHVQGARHVPMEEVPERHEEIATDREVVCVCRSGAPSGKVADELRQAGHEAENMDGGRQAWDDEGLPFVAEAGSAGQPV